VNKPLWKKVTHGGLRLRQNRERIKPGQRIRATREELGRFIGEFELIETPNDSEEGIPNEQDRNIWPDWDEWIKGKDSTDEYTGSSPNMEE